MEHPTPPHDFESLFHEHFNRLRILAERLFFLYGGSHDWGRAEEAAQEAFSIAWEKQAVLLSSPNPGGWLTLTLQNVVKNMLRQDLQWNKRLLQAQQTLPQSPVQPPPGADLELEDLISQEEFNLLKRVYLEHATYDELCQELGIKKSALSMRIQRAKERFREEFQKSEEISAPASGQTEDTQHKQHRGGSKK